MRHCGRHSRVRVHIVLGLAGLLTLAPVAAARQEPSPEVHRDEPTAGIPPSESARPNPQPDAPVVPATPAAPPSRGGAARFFRDVGQDYVAWFKPDVTTPTLIVGTAITMSVRPADEALTDRGFDEVDDALTLGDEYGNLLFQVPFAIGWWGVGHAIGPRHADAGRDMLRAQISAASWTYAIKFAVGRTRPNGDPRSFPSGHSSATFAAATVLHRHYGWKAGLPLYALGVYTAAGRIHDRKHWLSDTVMGATVGIAAGHAVTFRLKERQVRVVPSVAHGSVGIHVVVDP